MQTAKQQLRSVLQHQLMVGQSAAKWLPRERSAQSKLAAEIRQYFGMTPKAYRKQLADLSETVEDLMCSQLWSDINFSHVPSIAASRYKKAFLRHAPAEFGQYVQALAAKDPSVKINAGAIFPYEIIKNRGDASDPTIRTHINAQWDALPNYVGDASILPLVDVSGSMMDSAGGGTTTTCLDVAVSLGLYLSQKNTGKFKDMFLTFSESPELLHLTGDVVDRLGQMDRSEWSMSTDIEAAFTKILEVAIAGKVPQDEMPKILLVLSDMQMNEATDPHHTAMDNVKAQYAAANYTIPLVVWWNLKHKGNVPVKCTEQGAALVSGFSPSLMKTILAADPTDFSPTSIMRATVCIPRYDI